MTQKGLKFHFKNVLNVIFVTVRIVQSFDLTNYYVCTKADSTRANAFIKYLTSNDLIQTVLANDLILYFYIEIKSFDTYCKQAGCKTVDLALGCQTLLFQGVLPNLWTNFIFSCVKWITIFFHKYLIFLTKFKNEILSIPTLNKPFVSNSLQLQDLGSCKSFAKVTNI